MKVAIQGVQGSFHELAAQQHFAQHSLEMVYCSTFEEVFAAIKADDQCLGVVAIENTIAGSLLYNYELLRASGASIVGEHKLHIEHSLLCLPDDSEADLKEVHSHPVALMQCRNFQAAHPNLKMVEAEDTAGAAAMIAQGQLHGHAAICHADAAPLYGLKVLQRAIEDNKHNFTRFLIVADTWTADQIRDPRESNKASIVFTLPHEEGSLSQVLSILSFYKISLTKIQSLPIIGREWQYLFYIDLVYDDFIRYRQSIDAVRPLTKQLRVLGEYKAFV